MKDVVEYIVGGVSAFSLILWGIMDRRVSSLEKPMEVKVDASICQMMRETCGKSFTTASAQLEKDRLDILSKISSMSEHIMKLHESDSLQLQELTKLTTCITFLTTNIEKLSQAVDERSRRRE